MWLTHTNFSASFNLFHRPKQNLFKLWMTQVAAERLDQMQDPELSINQALMDYKRLGYSNSWINQRLKSIEIRKDLTHEWKRHGL